MNLKQMFGEESGEARHCIRVIKLRLHILCWNITGNIFALTFPLSVLSDAPLHCLKKYNIVYSKNTSPYICQGLLEMISEAAELREKVGEVK